MDGVVTSPYGARVNPASGAEGFHEGVDIGAELGAEIAAVLDGAIIETGESATFGIYVVYQCGEYTITCAHMSEARVSAGDVVRQGDAVGLVGSTGLSTGSHLHIELTAGGELVDPAEYIAFTYAQ